MRELIGKAIINGKLTKSPGTSLLRHRKHHSEGNLLYMVTLMIEKHLSFSDAHEKAMTHVGR